MCKQYACTSIVYTIKNQTYTITTKGNITRKFVIRKFKRALVK